MLALHPITSTIFIDWSSPSGNTSQSLRSGHQDLRPQGDRSSALAAVPSVNIRVCLQLDSCRLILATVLQTPYLSNQLRKVAAQP